MGVIREHTQAIDGIAYTTQTMPASDGLKILPRLVALLGDSLTGLFFATSEEDRDKLLTNPKVLGAMISEISRAAAEDDGLLVLRDMLKSTSADLVRVGDAEIPASVHTHFDQHFAGRYRHLLEVCLWVGRVNFTNP